MNIWKMKPMLYWLILVLPQYISAQETGVKFEQQLSWEQIKKKAKTENKIIFVDCYATWCIPCKQMDKKVYTEKSVIDLINSRFIAIKIQADSSKMDSEYLKRWYKTAKIFTKQYNISAYPTHIFFSPDGKLIHRAEGYKDASQFIDVLEDSRNPQTQIYTLLDKYKRGQLKYSEMPSLSKRVKSLLKDMKLARAIARNYLSNYLSKLSDVQLLKKVNLEFINDNADVLTSKDRYFDLLSTQYELIDSMMGNKGFADKMTNFIISKEEIYDKIRPGGQWRKTEPDWNTLSKSLAKKFGESYTVRNILDAKIYWYYQNKKTDSIVKYEVLKRDSFGIDTTFIGCVATNNLAFDLIFRHVQDHAILSKAISWMNIIVNKHPDDAFYIDTYANLLYKLGKKSESIVWQEKAVMLNPKSQSMRQTLQKMKNNEATWIKE